MSVDKFLFPGHPQDQAVAVGMPTSAAKLVHPGLCCLGRTWFGRGQNQIWLPLGVRGQTAISGAFLPLLLGVGRISGSRAKSQSLSLLSLACSGALCVAWLCRASMSVVSSETLVST